MSSFRIKFQHGMSITEFLLCVGTEAQCAEAVEQSRWPKGFRCGRCGLAEYCVVKHGQRKLFQCSGWVPRRFEWKVMSHPQCFNDHVVALRARVKAGRRPPEGLGLDASARQSTLAKGLSDRGFLAGKPDGRGRLAPFPLAGRAGG